MIIRNVGDLAEAYGLTVDEAEYIFDGLTEVGLGGREVLSLMEDLNEESQLSKRPLVDVCNAYMSKHGLRVRTEITEAYRDDSGRTNEEDDDGVDTEGDVKPSKGVDRAVCATLGLVLGCLLTAFLFLLFNPDSMSKSEEEDEGVSCVKTSESKSSYTQKCIYTYMTGEA